MKRSAFAALLDISKQMISKHAEKGRIVEADGSVDVAASLAALEGHMDEAKRQRALQITGAASVARAPTMAPERSSKAQIDDINRDIKRLELGKLAGELVDVAGVEDAASRAVTQLRERVAQGHRETADRICAQFGVGPEKAVALARFLAKEFEGVMGQFARAMQQLAAADAAQAADNAAVPTEFDADLPLLAAGAR